jgi:hypothetical protein
MSATIDGVLNHLLDDSIQQRIWVCFSITVADRDRREASPVDSIHRFSLLHAQRNVVSHEAAR